MKNLAVVISGLPVGNNVREITLQPGTEAGSVLAELGLRGYLLSREGSAQAFANEENLYAAVEDGEKLRATPIAEVGGFLDDVLQFFGFQTNVAVDQPEREVVLKATRSAPARQRLASTVLSPAHRRPRTRIGPDNRQLWEVRGWRREGDKLIGAYRTPRGSLAGEISLASRQPDFYVMNPPNSILSGSHGACFRSRGGNRYFVHFGLANPEIDAGIVAIEKLVANALTGRA